MEHSEHWGLLAIHTLRPWSISKWAKIDKSSGSTILLSSFSIITAFLDFTNFNKFVILVTWVSTTNEGILKILPKTTLFIRTNKCFD